MQRRILLTRSLQIQDTVPTYTSQWGPCDNDDSTISSQLSVTRDANASFTQPIAEGSVHSSTTLANQHSIIGSNISFEIESPNMPTYANVDQVSSNAALDKVFRLN